jgi:hypothetical protein
MLVVHVLECLLLGFRVPIDERTITFILMSALRHFSVEDNRWLQKLVQVIIVLRFLTCVDLMAAADVVFILLYHVLHLSVCPFEHRYLVANFVEPVIHLLG